MIFVEGMFLSRMMVITTPKMVGNATFILLKMRTRSTKTFKEEDTQWLNDALSMLNPKN
jgi:hypothetical protein